MTITTFPLYAAIDLGSNSFHLLLVREIQGSVQTVAKIKRKVRLAAGLDEHFILTEEAMQRGWDCLALFAERLQDIPAERIRVVATAALRCAKNADLFIAKGNDILGHPIDVISGEKEAHLIYQGVANTTGGKNKRLAVDIGGASTEIIVAQGFDIKALMSLNMGCVTWLDRYFKDGHLTKTNFAQAIDAAKCIVRPVATPYLLFGWQSCVGASGTVQALQEILLAQGFDETITLETLYQLRQQVIDSAQLDKLDIKGLAPERALLFPSGLSILIAIFEVFLVDSMTLAGGALREGLAYGMIDHIEQTNIRERTLNSIQSRFCIDAKQASNVAKTALELLKQSASQWTPEPLAKELLLAAAALHEIGLSIAFKCEGDHAAYLIKHLDLPGFTSSQKELISEMLRIYRGKLHTLGAQNALSSIGANRLLRLLRLAVILCHRRSNKLVPDIALKVHGETLTLILPKGWIEKNALMAAELTLEAQRQCDNHWPLIIRS